MKDWENIDDNEFDETFRESAGSFEEPLWPEAWSLMEEKLDEKDKKRRIIVFWRWAAAIFMIFSAGLIGNLYFRQSNSQETIAKTDQKISDEKKVSNSKTKQEGENADNLTFKENRIEGKGNLFTNPKNNEIGNKTQKSKRDLAVNKYQSKGSFHKKNVSEINNSKTDNKISKIEVDKTLKKSDSEELVAKTETTQKTESGINDTKIEKLGETTALNENSTIEADSDTVIVTMEETGLNDMQEFEPPKKSVFQRLGFNLGFSPDFSKVEDSPIGKTGYNFQLLVNYNITQKLTLKAGAMKSLKLYDANAGYYAWPARWGVPSSPLTYVAASCNMWDFPVSLSYNFKQKGNNIFYTSLGITNYKMVKEKYTYHYENDADPNIKWRKWQGSTGFYGAGVVNFSLGLERKISKKLSIQIEPFVKIPLKSVGFGSVKLASTGLFMNVKLPNLKK